MMACWAEPVETFIEAVEIVIEGLGRQLVPGKVFWCSYPAFQLDRDKLNQKMTKDIDKLLSEFEDNETDFDRTWYVGIPEIKLNRRGIPSLCFEIDLYYVISGTENSIWGKLMSKADNFECPLCLMEPLVEALKAGKVETEDAHIVEKGYGYSVYDFMAKEWKIPDAFLGFLWALKEKGLGFEGLLDPISCQLMEKFTKELPLSELPKLRSGDDYEAILTCLREQMGYPKVKAEEAAEYVMAKFSNETLEYKIKQALSYLSG